MGFAEALSDDGSLTGPGPARAARRHLRCDDDGRRHRPHAAVPDPELPVATVAAVAVVAVELVAISWIRYRYMDTPFLQASFQVIVGGVLVFCRAF